MTTPRTPFNIPPGIVVDDTSHASAGGWLDTNGVRFYRNRPQVVGGSERFVDGELGGFCRSIFPWTDNMGSLNVAFGCDQALNVAYGGTIFDVTPVGLAAGLIDGTGGVGYGTGTWDTGTFSQPSNAEYYPRTWTFGGWGEWLIANPRGQGVFVWKNDTTAPAVLIADAPPRVESICIAPGKRQILAFGCSERVSGDFNPMLIRGSDLEDLENWTPASDNNSFSLILEGGGRLVRGLPVGYSIFAWSDSALYRGEYLGDPTQPWRFDPIGQNCGLIGQGAAVVVGQTAYWLATNGQLYTCALGGEPRQIESPLVVDMFENLAAAQADKITCAHIAGFNEVRWHYPDARDGNEVSRYIALSLNSANGGWSRGLTDRAAITGASPAPYPIAVDGAAAVAYYQERGHTDDGAAFAASIESADQFIGNAEQLMFIRGFWPDFQGQTGPISLWIITRTDPQGPETTFGPFVMGPQQRKVDFRVSARIARVRIESNSAPNYWRMGAPSFDAIPTSDN